MPDVCFSELITTKLQVVMMSSSMAYRPLLQACAGYLLSYSLAHVCLFAVQLNLHTSSSTVAHMLQDFLFSTFGETLSALCFLNTRQRQHVC